MGVWKRPSGKWSYEFKYQGKRYGRYDFRTKGEAQAAEAREKERLRQSRTLITFGEAGNKRLDYLKAFRTHAHYRDNQAMLRRFSDWASLPLEAITPEMVRSRLIELSQELGNHNANRHHCALTAVFSQALKDGFINRNPCYGLPKFPVEKTIKYIPPREHISQVLLSVNALDRAYLTVIWLTGARVREINRLTWKDVDFDGRLIRLWTRKKKNGNRTCRQVPMVSEVERALKYAWEQRDKNSPYVFTNPKTGKAYDYRDKFIATACKRLGIPKINYHDFRHHTASTLAQKGASLTDIQKILGHERATTTDHYLQSLGESVRRAMGLLEQDTTESTTKEKEAVEHKS